jgi:hypothetical protein
VNTANLTALVTAAAAVLALVVTWAVYAAGQRRTQALYLESLWTQILSFTQDHPELCDVSRTMHYLRAMNWAERLSYDAMCLNAWSVIYEANIHAMAKRGRMQLAFEWVAAFHMEWLMNNAHLFPDRHFWHAINEVEATESRLVRHRPVPSLTGSTTWDELSPRYFRTVLSPFDPALRQGNRLTDTILSNLTEMQQLRGTKPIRIVDLGCGIGNLVSWLTDYASGLSISYTGIDISGPALNVARQRSAHAGFACDFVAASRFRSYISNRPSQLPEIAQSTLEADALNRPSS